MAALKKDPGCAGPPLPSPSAPARPAPAPRAPAPALLATPPQPLPVPPSPNSDFSYEPSIYGGISDEFGDHIVDPVMHSPAPFSPASPGTPGGRASRAVIATADRQSLSHARSGLAVVPEGGVYQTALAPTRGVQLSDPGPVPPPAAAAPGQADSPCGSAFRERFSMAGGYVQGPHPPPDSQYQSRYSQNTYPSRLPSQVPLPHAPPAVFTLPSGRRASGAPLQQLPGSGFAFPAASDMLENIQDVTKTCPPASPVLALEDEKGGHASWTWTDLGVASIGNAQDDWKAERRRKATRKWIIAVAAVALLALIIGLAVGVSRSKAGSSAADKAAAGLSTGSGLSASSKVASSRVSSAGTSTSPAATSTTSTTKSFAFSKSVSGRSSTTASITTKSIAASTWASTTPDTTTPATTTAAVSTATATAAHTTSTEDTIAATTAAETLSEAAATTSAAEAESTTARSSSHSGGLLGGLLGLKEKRAAELHRMARQVRRRP